MKKQQSRRVLVLDGQRGGMGAQLIRLLAPVLPQDCVLRCVGTNVLATNAMLKAGAAQGATGENAVIYNAARALSWQTASWARFRPPWLPQYPGQKPLKS